MALASLNERVLFYNWALSGEKDFVRGNGLCQGKWTSDSKNPQIIVFSYGKVLQCLLKQLRLMYLLFIIKFLQDSTNTMVLKP